MKLSNKILIGFFGFIFIYLTAAFAELRLNGIPNFINDTNSMAETVDLEAVSYLIIKDVDKNVQVIGSDRPRLEVRSFSGDWLAKLTYSVSGDTLTLSNLHAANTNIRVSVFVPKAQLKEVAVNTASATVKGLQQNRLHLSQKSGSIWLRDCQLTKMEIELEQSYLEVSGTVLDTLSAQLDKSQVNILSPVGILQGSLKNSASMRLNDLEEIQIKKDKSSRLLLY
ncbi:MAG: DUF4097 family beta strand repeat protein [Cyclobacteriaceae bacterium]|nr:DUF4097 family beta strand repeat protein [Cyclobacteriaceae bacterium]